MSKLLNKFLENYSFATLRDVFIDNLTNNDSIVYNSTTQRFENKKITGLQDHHAGWFNVPADETVEIESNKISIFKSHYKRSGYIKRTGFKKRSA